MPMSYTQFLTQVATALHEEDGLTLAFLIRPTSPHGKDLVKEFRNPTVRHDLPAIYFSLLTHFSFGHLGQRQNLSRYEGTIDSPWDEISIQYVLVTSHVARQRYADAYKEHTSLVK